ncbi:hypothetical protein Aperf_G00000021107 [Anoplocephala perfoliata]
MSDQQINTEAEEYVPNEVKVRSKIKDITSQAFDSKPDSSESAIRTLEGIIKSATTYPLSSSIGEALAKSALIKSGNAAIAFKIIKQLQFSVPESGDFLLERGFLNELHVQTLNVVDKASLKEVVGNTTSRKEVTLLFAELVHLLSLSISELHKSGTEQLEVVPWLSPCVDLCLITSAALRIQLETTKKATSSPPDSKAVVNWGNLIEAFISAIIQALPSFNLLLQISEFVPTSASAWVSTSCLREPADLSVLENNPNLKEMDSLTVQHLASLLDEVLYLLKFLVVVDNGLPSRYVRSSAMDLLLSAAAVVPPAPLTVDPPSEEVDEEVNLFDQENPEVMQDFQNFLQTSGQL